MKMHEKTQPGSPEIVQSAGWNTLSLDVLLSGIWTRLRKGCDEKQDAWHTAGVATIANGQPAVRTIVLRSVDSTDRSLGFFSDVRSDKIQQLLERPMVEWLFYDPVERVQLRAQSVATVHHLDALAEAAWNAKPDLNYLHYLSPLPPGTSLPASVPLQDGLEPEHEIAFRNFAVVLTQVESFDWLVLHDTFHRRASFQWNGNFLESRWKVP